MLWGYHLLLHLVGTNLALEVVVLQRTWAFIILAKVSRVVLHRALGPLSIRHLREQKLTGVSGSHLGYILIDDLREHVLILLLKVSQLCLDLLLLLVDI